MSQERVQFIRHGSTQILSIDFSRTKEPEFLEILRKAESIIHAQPPLSVLTLSNMHEACYSKTVLMALQRYVAGNTPYTRARAVIGLNDLKRIAFNMLNRVKGIELKAFEDEESAIKWLAERG